jgi:formyl-CoA transferase
MRIGEIVPAASGSGTKPLAGVRILAIEHMQALPFATQLLAHLGAEVVKVEHPVHGDSGRGSLPAVGDADGRQVGATYLRNNLNKRSIAVDLKHPEGVALIKRLVPRYDVVGENFKPGTMDRLGLGYRDLAAVYSRLVYVSVSGFGNLIDSPYAAFPAYAPIAEAMAGFYDANHDRDTSPVVGPSGALGDIGSALFAAIGVLAALRHRDRTGEGQHVDIAMYDAMIAMADLVPFMWSMGVRKGQQTPGIFNAFKASDGYFVVQAVRDHQLSALSRAIGHPEWLEDERFKTRQGWAEHLESVVRPAMEDWAAQRTKLDASTELSGQGISAGPCNTPEDVIADPHVQRHNMLIEVPRRDASQSLLIVGNPIKMSATTEGPVQRWPMLGEHTAEVLKTDLGLSDDEIASLAERQVVVLTSTSLSAN